MLPAYFTIKVLIGILLLKFSATYLSGLEFTLFSQFLFLSALLNMVAAGGLQIGLILEVASAKGDRQLEGRIISNGLAICLAIAILVCLPIFSLRGAMSELLLDTRQYAGVVVAVAILSVSGAPGQIFCALLSGRQKPAASMFSQASGLLIGGGGALTFLFLRYPVHAVLTFASAPVITAAVSFCLSRMGELPITWRSIGSETALRLLRYSGAFLLTASLFPTMLLVQRYLYLEHFGVTALNQWIVASKISEVTTQLLALYMANYFLPGYVSQARPNSSVSRGILLGGAMMLCFAASFALFGDTLISLFLSPQFLSAKTGTLSYMVGDVLRVGVSVALHASLGDKRLLRYIGIEAAVVASFGIITFFLIQAEKPWAPFAGYIGGYLIVCLAVGIVYARHRLTRRTDRRSDE